MIFQTITNESTGAIKSIGLFGKSLTQLRVILSTIKSNGIISTIFKMPSIDKLAITKYNNEISKGTSAQNALALASIGTNKSTIAFMKSANGATISMEQLTAAQKASTLAAKAQSIAFKAISIAGNMFAMWAISQVLSQVTKYVNDFIHASENARRASSELTNSWKEENSSIDENILKYKELKQKLNDTALSASQVKTVKEELATIQDTLIKKYGQEAFQLDLINGKYNQQIAALDELSKKRPANT